MLDHSGRADLIDRVDWASLNHAYGPATDVPGRLRDLVSGDGEVRRAALVDLYGNVLHQGSVYDATLACVPFLLAVVADACTPGRAEVVALLGEICDSLNDFPEEFAATPWPGDGGEVFVRLLADPDPQIRLEAARAVATCRDDSGTVMSVLRRRLGEEANPAVRVGLAEAVRALAPYMPDVADVREVDGEGGPDMADATSVRRWLAEVAAGDRDPKVRGEAVSCLVEWVPESLPAGVVPAALGVELTEWLVERLSDGLGDRVAERLELITALLRDPDPGRRLMVMEPAAALVDGWRGDYRRLAALLGTQLSHPDPQLAAAAAVTLHSFGRLAAPAADDLAAYVAAGPREGRPRLDQHFGWITVWPDHPPMTGYALVALAGLRDERALPAVRWALEREDPPKDIGRVLGSMGPVAAGLVPVVRRRLHDLAGGEQRAGLVRALGEFGEAAAAAVPELLALPGDLDVVTTLGRIGPSAQPAVPALRRALESDDPHLAVAAATALWRIEQDAGRALPLLARHLAEADHDRPGVATVVAAVAELGPAAAPLAGRLREWLDARSPDVRWRAAVALWRATADARSALPVLLDAWEGHVACRLPAARVFAEMGAAAGAAVPALRAEQARIRRHQPGQEGGTDTIAPDEDLRAACADALRRIGETAP
ncbi:hypothetical protein HII36_20155 [Nonomuraea sp. NN258]|uniref:HEAT repeat domain-containing protein n=1 Tax=Nonomuraea antri TaxID=2730852 RepID=UPI001569B8AC|nr:HEAT repeat domain-containing protein [Nonomuraea antri]NRQ34146.1 hypothetical protein [Nonomuraea antri]